MIRIQEHTYRKASIYDIYVNLRHNTPVIFPSNLMVELLHLVVLLINSVAYFSRNATSSSIGSANTFLHDAIFVSFDCLLEPLLLLRVHNFPAFETKMTLTHFQVISVAKVKPA